MSSTVRRSGTCSTCASSWTPTPTSGYLGEVRRTRAPLPLAGPAPGTAPRRLQAPALSCHCSSPGRAAGPGPGADPDAVHHLRQAGLRGVLPAGTAFRLPGDLLPPLVRRPPGARSVRAESWTDAVGCKRGEVSRSCSWSRGAVLSWEWVLCPSHPSSPCQASPHAPASPPPRLLSASVQGTARPLPTLSSSPPSPSERGRGSLSAARVLSGAH